jgi:hypothetical protein
MEQNVISSFIKKQIPFLLLIGIWLVYFLIDVTLQQSKETVIYAEILVFIGLDFVNASLIFFLWKRTTGQEKIIFALFNISFLMLAIADANFYILGITHYPEVCCSSV